MTASNESVGITSNSDCIRKSRAGETYILKYSKLYNITYLYRNKKYTYSVNYGINHSTLINRFATDIKKLINRL